jgi:hypothetical protein
MTSAFVARILQIRIALFPLLLAIAVLNVGCQTVVPAGPQVVQNISEARYIPIYKRYTQTAKEYSGFHNTFEARMTFLHSELNTLRLRRKGHYLRWSLDRFQKEREKLFQEMSTEAKAFLLFYTPEIEYDDLAKPNTIWKLYLEFDGQRYEGKVDKAKEKRIELQAQFPDIDPFSSSYFVTFPLPTSLVEDQAFTIILTSSVGTAKYVIKP